MSRIFFFSSNRDRRFGPRERTSVYVHTLNTYRNKETKKSRGGHSLKETWCNTLHEYPLRCIRRPLIKNEPFLHTEHGSSLSTLTPQIWNQTQTASLMFQSPRARALFDGGRERPPRDNSGQSGLAESEFRDLRSASLERPIHISRDVPGELHDAPRVCSRGGFIPDVTKILHTSRTHNSTQRSYLSSWPCFTTGPTRYATSGLRAHVTYNVH